MNAVTTYNYNTDDSISSVVDARGAAANYTYDNRGLTTQVSTTSPNPATIPVTPTVTFAYDNLGNRTQMTDGLGSTTYAYDQLSQLTSETRGFSGVTGSFTLGYDYTLAGGLNEDYRSGKRLDKLRLR